MYPWITKGILKTSKEISVYNKSINKELQYRNLKYITPKNEKHCKKYKNLEQSNTNLKNS